MHIHGELHKEKREAKKIFLNIVEIDLPFVKVS